MQRSFIFLGILILAAGTTVALAQEPAHHHGAAEAPGQTLKEIMPGLGAAAAVINDGLWKGDFEIIAQGAHAVVEHPPIAGAEVERIQKILGKDFPKFEKVDILAHEQATKVAHAAHEQNMRKVLAEYAAMQSACVSCHTDFKAKLKVP